MNRWGFVEFWKIIPIFAQEKEFVIKLLKFLNLVNSSVQATASLGVARKAIGGLHIYIYILWSSSMRNKGKKKMKKKGVQENEIGMGYCPFWCWVTIQCFIS